MSRSIIFEPHISSLEAIVRGFSPDARATSAAIYVRNTGAGLIRLEVRDPGDLSWHTIFERKVSTPNFFPLSIEDPSLDLAGALRMTFVPDATGGLFSAWYVERGMQP